MCNVHNFDKKLISKIIINIGKKIIKKSKYPSNFFQIKVLLMFQLKIVKHICWSSFLGDFSQQFWLLFNFKRVAKILCNVHN